MDTRPILFDDMLHVVKDATGSKSCNTVITKLSEHVNRNMEEHQTVDSVSKESHAKVQVLQFWRNHCGPKNIELMIKPSSSGHKEISTRTLTDVASSTTRERLSRASIKKISDLAFYFRYQKKKVQRLSEKTEKSPQFNSTKTMPSRESNNSMDAFLARADLGEMAHFLSFCGKVTHEKLQSGTTGTPKRKCADRQTLEQLSNGEPNRQPTRSNSTESIESADTGYESVGQESGDQIIYAIAGADKPLQKRRRTAQLSDDYNGPRHSTPVVASRRHERDRDCETYGKSVIMEKFMTDQQKATQQLAISPRQQEYVEGLELPENDKRTSERTKRSFMLNDVNIRSIQNIDVDSPKNIMHSGPRTLRRESAFANLRKCSESNFRLPAHAHTTQETLFEYSFECSVPNPDTYQSADFTYSFTETCASDIIDAVMEKHVLGDATIAMKSLSIDSTCGEEFDNLFERNIYSVDESDYLNDSRV